MIKNLIKTTIRNFQKQFGFSMLNIIGLSIGMASFILIMMWIMDELNFDKNHSNADHIFLLHKSYFVSGSQKYNSSTPAPLAIKIKNDFPEVIAATRFAKYDRLVRYENKVFNDQIYTVDPDFLKMFSFNILVGDPISSLNEPNSVIISERIAEKYFGAKNPIGQVLIVDNENDYKVTAVFENPPDNTSVGYNIITHLDDFKYRNNWDDHHYDTFIMLSEEADVNDLDEKMSEIMHQKSPTEDIGIRSMPLNKLHLYSIDGENQRIQYVRLFIIIAVFILLIACINFMNLSTARANRRGKEIGLRKVVGARKGHLISQFLVESIVFSFLSLIIAMVLAELLKPFFNQLTNKSLMIDYADPAFFVGVIMLILFVGLLAGSYPALFLSSFRPIVALKGTFNIGIKGLLFRKILVILQFSISIILIISTFIIYSQINFVQYQDQGFKKENIIFFRAEGDIKDRFDSFKNKLLEHPNIIDVSRTSQLPSEMWDIRRGVKWEGSENPNGSILGQCAVDYDYFKTMGMDIVQGRSLSKEYGTDTKNFVLNQKAVDFIGWENPIGKHFGGREGKSGIVVGVVKNFNSLPATHGIQPMFFFYRTTWFRNVLIKIGPGNPKETTLYIEDVFLSYAPQSPFELSFLDQRINEQYKSEQTIGELSAIFAFIAIIISCLGLFGLAAFSAEQKTKEIGIRKIFGASVKHIIYKLSVSFTLWVLLANLIAWPIAYLTMENWLNNFAFRVNIYWWIFALAALISISIALLTVGFQTLRSARKNPIDTIRC